MLAADALEVLFFDLVGRLTEMGSQKLYLPLDDPDIALFRAGTTIAASGTLKVQASLIPYNRVHSS